MSLTSHLKPHRLAAGLTQAALADMVGISRQALAAVEAGRQVPSTRVSLALASVLGCTVEKLFELRAPSGIGARSATLPADRARAGARVILGCIDGRWAAHHVDAPSVAADGVVQGVSSEGVVDVTPFHPPAPDRVLVAGCAPLLGLAAEREAGNAARRFMRWVPANSGVALELLAEDLVHVAGVHLVAASDQAGHEPLIRQRLPNRGHTIVHLARWRQGLIVAAGNPLGIQGSDLRRPDLRFAHRESGSAAHTLWLKAGGSPTPGPHDTQATSHEDIARLVAWGLADAGVGIESAAVAHHLGFVPLSEERFDLVVPTHRLGEPAIGRLFESIGSPSFRREASHVPGYDVGDSGATTTVEAPG